MYLRDSRPYTHARPTKRFHAHFLDRPAYDHPLAPTAAGGRPFARQSSFTAPTSTFVAAGTPGMRQLRAVRGSGRTAANIWTPQSAVACRDSTLPLRVYCVRRRRTRRAVYLSGVTTPPACQSTNYNSNRSNSNSRKAAAATVDDSGLRERSNGEKTTTRTRDREREGEGDKQRRTGRGCGALTEEERGYRCADE